VASPVIPLIQRIFGAFNPQTGALIGFTPSGEQPYAAVLGNAQVVPSFAALRLLLSSQVQTAFATGAVTQADGGGGTFVYNSSDTSSGFWGQGSASGTVLTITKVFNGTVAVGQYVNRGDTGVTLTTIASNGTGSGGLGTYNLNANVGSIPGPITITCDNDSTVLVGADGGRWDIAGFQLTSLPNNLVPAADNTYNLGSALLRWASAFIVSLTVSGALTVGGAFAANGGVSSSLIPTVADLDSLGSASFPWAQLYVGANAAPLIDPTTGGIGYVKQTPAELSLSLVPTVFFYQESDIRRYGATTGASDNHVAINNALAVSNAGGNPCYIPPGTWKITSALTPNGQSSIYGVGLESIIAPQSCDGLDIGNNTSITTAGSNRIFRDFQIVGTGTSGSNNGIQVNYTAASGNRVWGAEFRNIYISGFQYGFYLRGLWNSNLYNCVTWNCNYGIYFIGQNIKTGIFGGFVYGNTGTCGVSITSTAGETTQSTQIIGSQIYGWQTGIICTLAVELQIEACDISACTVAPLSLTICNSGGWVRDCFIQNVGTSGSLYGVQLNDLGVISEASHWHILDNDIECLNAVAGSLGIYWGNSQVGHNVCGNQINYFDEGISINGAASNGVCRDNRIAICTSVYSANSFPIQVNALAADMTIGPNYIIPGTTVSAGMTNASANITVPSAAAFPVGTPCQFSASVNGFNANCYYFVTSSSGTTIQVSNVASGTAITATGNSAVNVTPTPLPLQFNTAATPPGLAHFSRGAFVLPLTGFSSTVLGLCHYVCNGKSVSVNPDWNITWGGTSNATTMTSQLPVQFLCPEMEQQSIANVEDSGTYTYGMLTVTPAGLITFYKTPNAGAFTASGAKAVNSLAMRWDYT
jgi:hypothetical protein